MSPTAVGKQERGEEGAYPVYSIYATIWNGYWIGEEVRIHSRGILASLCPAHTEHLEAICMLPSYLAAGLELDHIFDVFIVISARRSQMQTNERMDGREF